MPILTKVTHTHTAEMSSTLDPTAQEVIDFLTDLPRTAKISVQGTSTYPGDHGIMPWKITATWTDDQ